VLLDAAALIRAARRRAGLTQSELAARSGTSAAAVSRYERAALVPSTGTLVRLLAGAGLQARCTLEPLLAGLDERVRAFAEAVPALDVESLEALTRSLADAPHGPVSWALDGPTALAAHGLGPRAEGFECLVVQLDEPGRRWLRAAMVQGVGPRGAVSWLDVELAEAQSALGTLAWSLPGLVRLRVVDHLPAVLQLVPAGLDRVVPVLPVHAVEPAWPQLAEVLVRLREQATGAGRTVVR
jgi:transcriptional regulator with XRE-family HTH domain